MVWTTPTPRTTGELITASIWNTDLRDNLVLLKTSIANDGKLAATGGTLNSTVLGSCAFFSCDSTAGIYRRPALQNYTEYYIPHNVSDWAGGNIVLDLTYAEQYLVVNLPIASIAFVNSPWFAGQITTVSFLLTYPDNTPRAINWGGAGLSIRWSGGQAFVPTCLSGFFDIVTMRTFDNVTWFAAVYGQKM